MGWDEFDLGLAGCVHTIAQVMGLADSMHWCFRSLLAGALLGGGVVAQDPVSQDPVVATAEPQEPEEPKPWQPPEPEDGGWDWIQLTSQEWLKGELISVRDGKLEFDSDEMDMQSFDLSDVAIIRSPRRLAVVLPDRSVIHGTVLLRDGNIVVVSPDGPKELDRRQVVSIVPEGSRELDLWSGDFSLGLTAQRGNTDQSLLKMQAELTRRSAYSRWNFRYIGNIGETDRIQNVNNHRLTAKWDLFLSQKWFLTPLSFEAYKDKFQNIDYQLLPAIGVGYHAIDNGIIEWDVTLGGGYRYTRWESVIPPAEPDEDIWVVIPGTRFNWDITSDLEFDLTYSVQVGVPETENTNHHLIAKLDLDLTGNLELDITFEWNRIGQPQPDAEGNVPVPDDYSTSIGLGWDF